MSAVGAEQPSLNARRQPEAMRRALIAKIADWLAANFALPSAATPPTVKLVPRNQLAALQYHGAASILGDVDDIVALYDGSRQTIYLPEEGRGDTPIGASILVHEMVHFLQDDARQTFECSQARERLAYAAQERWLANSGHNLAQDFDVDAFTLLVRASCMH
ncbi:MAG: DUF6647 family protein [Hyphomicrobiaceae bacterium]